MEPGNYLGLDLAVCVLVLTVKTKVTWRGLKTTIVQSPAGWKKEEGCSLGSHGRGGAKGLLGGVHHVEEAILVPLPFVDLTDGSRHGDHAVAIDQQEESLVGVQLEAPPGGETGAWQSEEGRRREEIRGKQRKDKRVQIRGGKEKERRIKGRRGEERKIKERNERRGLEVYLIILMSSLMLTWSGTRNLVLSRMGSCFSPLYLSMITCKTHSQPQ